MTNTNEENNDNTKDVEEQKMTRCNKTTFKQSSFDMCKFCIYDPGSSGNWRQQVAACVAAHCPNFEKRPMPRNCRKAGEHNPEVINALRAKLDADDRMRATR